MVIQDRSQTSHSDPCHHPAADKLTSVIADSSAPAASSARAAVQNPFNERGDVGVLNFGCVHLNSLAIEDAGACEDDVKFSPLHIIIATGRGVCAKSIMANLASNASATDRGEKEACEIYWHEEGEARLMIGARRSCCRGLDFLKDHVYNHIGVGLKWHAFATVVKLCKPWCGQAQVTVMAVDVIEDANTQGLGDAVANAIATMVTDADVRVIGGFFGKSLGIILEAVRKRGVDLNVAAWQPYVVKDRTFVHPLYLLVAGPWKVALINSLLKRCNK